MPGKLKNNPLPLLILFSLCPPTHSYSVASYKAAVDLDNETSNEELYLPAPRVEMRAKERMMFTLEMLPDVIL